MYAQENVKKYSASYWCKELKFILIKPKNKNQSTNQMSNDLRKKKVLQRELQ